jgi:RNA polymerase sigma-70 factor, ECF subfamily
MQNAQSSVHNPAHFRAKSMEQRAVTRDQEVQFRKSLVELMPYAKGFARTLLNPKGQYHSLYEDFVQQAFLKAWENRDGFQAGSNLKAWLFTIIRNGIVSYHRRHWRELVTDQAQDPQAPNDTANPERAVATKQSISRFAKLKQAHQEALSDLAWDGLSYEESAKRRGVPTGTIKSRVARAREVLAELIEGGDRDFGRGAAQRIAPMAAG